MILLTDLISEFHLKAVGNVDKKINGPGSLKTRGNDRIYWLKNVSFIDQFTEGALIISDKDFNLIEISDKICYLITEESPRLIFAKILTKHFSNLGLKLSSNQANYHRLNKEITISSNVYIGENVTIGNGTEIHPNVVIHNNTTIGSNCVIKANCSIATDGLGYEKDESGWNKFPQLGGVEIGNDVVMGPSATIRRGALDNTIIEDGVKIGSFVNIGHNCIIGKNSILTCQCVTGGSTVLAQDVYMGIQSITRNGINVGKNVTIGAGAIVVKNIPENITVIGSPAIPIEEYKGWSRIKKSIIRQENNTQNE